MLQLLGFLSLVSLAVFSPMVLVYAVIFYILIMGLWFLLFAFMLKR